MNPKISQQLQGIWRFRDAGTGLELWFGAQQGQGAFESGATEQGTAGPIVLHGLLRVLCMHPSPVWICCVNLALVVPSWHFTGWVLKGNVI
jgi:hypothetical protein